MAGKRKRTALQKKTKVKTKPSMDETQMSEEENYMEEMEESSVKMKKAPAKEKMKNKKKAVAGGEESESDSDFEAFLNKDELEKDSDDEEETKMEEDGEEEEEEDYKSFRQTMKDLEKKDPEFYKYLQENDKSLLESDEDDDEEMEHKDEEDAEEEMEHYVDDDDEEDEVQAEEEAEVNKLTLALISSWKESLKEKPTIKVLRQVVQALHKALFTMDDGSLVFSGLSEFNNLVLICLKYVPSSFNALLKIKSDQVVTSSRNWKRLSPLAKIHLRDLLKMFQKLTETDLLSALLKYLRQLVPLCLPFPSIQFNILKMLVKQWSSETSALQKLSYRAIKELLEDSQEKFTAFVLKAMYRAFVSHAKFTKDSSLATLAYMRGTLADAYQRKPQLAFEHCGLFLKMLALQMRSAMNHKTKEHYAAVYNWQYIHCLHLWADVISSAGSCETLVYPLGMLLLGTIDLIPAARYLPLRFHVVRIANQLSYRTGFYIPTFLPAFKALELLNLQKNVVVKNWPKRVRFSSILRLSQGELRKPLIKLSLVRETCLLMVECLALHAGAPHFPGLAVVPAHRIHRLLKKISYIGYKKPLKQVLDKLEENSAFVKSHPIRFDSNDLKKANEFQQRLEEEGPPLVKFLAEFREQMSQDLITEPPKEDSEDESEDISEDKKKQQKKKTIPEPSLEAEDEVQDLVISGDEEEEKQSENSDDDDFDDETDEDDDN